MEIAFEKSHVSVDYALVRPPTAAYRERDEAAAWRGMEFPPTAAKGCRIRFLNLEGAFPETGALEELVLPLGQGIKSGAHGCFILGVVTSDEPVANYVSYIAEKHSVPLFLSASPEAALESSSPVGNLTAAESATLDTVRALGGWVTSSKLANSLGLELTAAGNRLTKLEKKGFLFRIPRAQTKGDVYIDPREILEVSSSYDTRAGRTYIPPEIRNVVLKLAEKQGRSASEVVGQVWREFFSRNKEELGEEFQQLRTLLDSDDTAGLERYLSQGVEDWAAEAVRAWDEE